MQRSHWHLSFQPFSQKLVSRNSTATTVSMPCIVSLLKPWRALRRGYTPPKRWSRHVEITCGLHHMWLRHLRYPPGHIHAIIRRLALSDPVLHPGLQGHHGPKAKTYQNLTVPTIWTLISSGGSCIAWVFFLEKKHKKLQVNLPQKQYTIQQCQPALDDAPCKASIEQQTNPVNRATEDMLQCRPHWSVCENCISGLHLASFTQHAIKHDLSVFGD